MLPRALCLLLFAFPLAAQQPAGSPAHPALPSAQGFQISGTVIHALNAEPLAGVEVAVAPTGKRDDFHTTVTDANGRFLFRDVAAGKYILAAKHRGFPQQLFEGHGPFSTAIAAGVGKNSEDLVFRLKPEGSISGRITDEQDDPVRAASVMLFVRNVESGEHTINLQLRASTDDQGGYHFGHLPAGSYYVAVSAKPWYAVNDHTGGRKVVPTSAGENPELDVAYPTTYYRQAIEPEQANPIRLNWGDRLTADIMLHAVPALHLRLTNQNPGVQNPNSQNPNSQNQDPAAGFEEAMLKQTLLGGTEVFVETQTVNVAPNAVEISGVPPGRYDLSVVMAKEKNGVGTSSSRHQAVNVSSSGDVDPSRGSELAAISGTVVFENQQGALPDASLQFHSHESGQYFDAPVSANGGFDLPEVHPGRYDVVLLNSGDLALKSISAMGAKVTGETVEIAGPGRVHLALIASKGNGRLEGVVLRGDKPVGGAMVVLVPRDPANNWPLFRRDQSDSDGSFELSTVMPGAYTLLAIENGWELEWANPAVLESYLPQGQPVQVEADSRLKINIKSVPLHGTPDNPSPTK